MKYVKPAVSKPTIGNRASEPVTTDKLLADLGYKLQPWPARGYSPSMPRYRRSGGKRGGFCPVQS